MAADKVLELGHHTLISKTDLKVHLGLSPYTVITGICYGWSGRGAYTSTLLSFGLQLAPKLFSVVAVQKDGIYCALSGCVQALIAPQGSLWPGWGTIGL